ncbi:MAG: IS66 family transposase [Moritella sp.]|nr:MULTISPECIES: transposase [unclassified Moritella]MCJ8352006.1 IS66 family transposase [Moritella sp.]
MKRIELHSKNHTFGFAGYLQCDGYSVYENIDDIIPVGCWAMQDVSFTMP